MTKCFVCTDVGQPSSGAGSPTSFQFSSPALSVTSRFSAFAFTLQEQQRNKYQWNTWFNLAGTLGGWTHVNIICEGISCESLTSWETCRSKSSLQVKHSKQQHQLKSCRVKVTVMEYWSETCSSFTNSAHIVFLLVLGIEPAIFLIPSLLL